MHCAKNDLILIIKNEDPGQFLINMVVIAARQLAILAYVFLFERTSLPAYIFVFANLKSILLKRKVIKNKQRIPAKEAVKNP